MKTVQSINDEQAMSAASLPAQDPAPDFDPGPLSWVQPEIDAALGRGLEALAAFAAAPAESTSLKHARNHVHQAAGALHLVGLDAVVAFVEEIERQLARLDDLDAPAVPSTCALIDGACRKLQIFLEELVNGAPPVPLKLFPEYDAMQRARGVRAAAPTDLFFPEIPDAPKFNRPAVVAAANLQSYLIKQRRTYQRGLLAWLRGDEQGARHMRDAVGAIEAATSQPNLRAFWWSTGALLDALVERGLDASFGVKQLAARIDLQIRRIAEGSAKVADRLRREVLYFVAIGAPVAPSVVDVQRTYKLAGLIPSAEVLSSDLVRLQPFLREARELLGSAKEAWLKCTSGRAENLPKLKQTLAAVHRHAAETGNGALLKLTHALVVRLDGIAPGNVSDPFAMEFATALLLAESAFENYAKLSPEFPQQVELMLARLEAAHASRPFEGGDGAPMLDEMSKRAQDRLLLAQVGREIQANLRHMEQVLDAFFRDHGKRDELASLAKDSQQIRGALRMLGLDTAEALLASCQEQIEGYADPAAEITDEGLELLAESLSGLGFYVEAVEQQRADHERLIAPLLARRRGEVAPAPVAAEDSVEVAVRELRAALPGLIAEVRRAPTDASARDALKTKLGVLRDDADLIGDAELVGQAKAALRELEEEGAAGSAMAAMAGPAGVEAAVPEVSAETQRILDSGDHALDAELLDIFLTEADEVLDTIAEQRRVLEHNPGDREALRNVRRQFHTLKGSGRMVGLTELGEIAYEVEKIHNRLLEEERQVTPAVLAMIASGELHFRGWVGELRNTGTVLPDPARLHETIRRVEEELPRGRESVLRPRAAAAAAPLALEPHAPALAPSDDMLEAAAPVLDLVDSLRMTDDLPAVDLVDSLTMTDVLPAVGAPETMPPIELEAAPPVAESTDEIVLEGEPMLDGGDAAPPWMTQAALSVPELEATLPPELEESPEAATHLSQAAELPSLDFLLEADAEVPDTPVDEEEFSAAQALASVFAAYEDVRNEEQARQEESAEPDAGATEAAGPSEFTAQPSFAAPAWDSTDDLPELGSVAEGNVELDAFDALDEVDAMAANDAVELTFDATEGDVDAPAAPPMAAAAIPVAGPQAAGDDIALDFLTFPDEETPTVVPVVHKQAVPPSSVDVGSVTLGSLDFAVDGASDGGSRPIDAAVSTAAGDAVPSLGLDFEVDTPAETVAAFSASDDLTIGEVTLPRALYEILTAEADDHLGTIAHELELLQFDPTHELSAAVVRASHTLCGIHRTGGFTPVAETAKSLEQCLAALKQHSEVPEPAQPVLGEALQTLIALVGRIKAQAPFTPDDIHAAAAVQTELDALRIDADRAAMAKLAALGPDAASSQAARALPSAVESAPGVPESAEVPADTACLEAFEPPLAFDVVPAQLAAIEEARAEIPREEPVAAQAASTPPASPVAPVAKAVAAVVETPLSEITDEVDAQLLPIFLEEAEELFPQAGEDLRGWRRHPGETSHASRLRRTLHTFKGSARMAGAMRLGELAHRMESRLLHGEDLAAGTPELFEALDTDLDRIAFTLDALREGRSDVALPWETASVVPAPASAEAIDLEAANHVAPPLDVATSSLVTTSLPVGSTPTPEASEPAAGAVEFEVRERAMLRVRADTVDRLVNEAGEVAITRARVDSEIRLLKQNLLELTSSVIRMRGQVREIEIQAESQIQSHLTLRHDTSGDFDPLEFDRYTRFQELTRSLAEGVNDVSTVQQALLRNVDDAESALAAQARLLREVQQQLFAVRTVPFGSMSERLYRIMRQVAKEVEKRVDLDIRGTQVELDRSVLEKLAGPLEHLLRNAIDHGVEAADARVRAGKPLTGQIVITVRQVGNEIAIEIADDGAGIDLERIRQRAVAQGRFAADAQPSEQQLVDCIFQHGFSTASKLTAVSGRGIGMDVVRSEIAALGGRVEVATQPARGTAFLLYLPLTLAVAQAVLVRAGGRLWAVPASMVEQVQQVKAEALGDTYASRHVNWQGREYPFHYLPHLLGELQHAPVPARSNPVLLLRTGQGTAAIHVDEMVGNQEVVVKNIGPQLARVSGIAGATVLGTGEIVLIINPVQLAHRPDVARFDLDGEDRVVRSSQAETKAGPPLALVVDDSLTVRKITSRLLAREGFDVETAKDGLDALQRLEERTPDVILLDIEMPRMDGFEFTKTIKADPRHAHIPIVMITSRTAEKHRSRARDLGVDLYLGKPFQEEELLRHLHDMLSVTA